MGNIRNSARTLRVLLGLLTANAALWSQPPPTLFLFQFGSPGQEYGKAITVDGAGDVIVAGTFQGTIDFDPGPGTVNLRNPAGVDMAVAKYSRLGGHRWAFNVSASGGVCVPNGVAVDPAGSIYLVGYFGIESGGTSTADFDPGPGVANLNATGGLDPFVAKYDRDGNYLWARVFNNVPAGFAEDRASDLAVDASGNVYFTGFLNGTHDLNAGAAGTRLYTSQGGSDAFLLKYDASGNFVWGFGAGGVGDDEGLGVGLDGDGHLFWMGHFTGGFDLDPGPGTRLISSAGNTDLFVARFTTGGAFETAFTIGGTQPELASPGAIRADPSGNVFLAGRFRGAVDFDPGPAARVFTNSSGTDNVFVASFTNALALRWAFPIYSNGAGDGAHRILPDSQGALWLAGWFAGTADFDGGPGVRNLNSRGTNGATDAFLARFAADGSLLWAHGFGAQLSGADNFGIAAGLALDRDDFAYATGQFFGQVDFDPSAGRMPLTSAGLNDGFVAKYDAQGNLLPTLIFPAFSGDPARYTGLAVANWGASDAQLELTAYGGSGIPLSSPPSIVNPSALRVPAGAQAARLAEQVFNLALSDPREGWIEAQSTSALVSGFFVQGSPDMRLLDGAVAWNKTAAELCFTRARTGPGVFPGGNYRNVLHVANPNSTSVRVDFRLFDEFGNLRDFASRNLPAKGSMAEETGSLFTNGATADGKGYIRLTSTAGVAGYQSVASSDSAFGLPAQEVSTAFVLYSAQFATGVVGGASYFTDLNLINRGPSRRSLRIALVGEGGGLEAPEVRVTLHPGQQERYRGDALFNLGNPTFAPLRQGTIVVTADGAGVMGDVVFGDPSSGRFLASLPLDGRPVSDLVFSQVAEGNAGGSRDYFTGIAAYNPNDTDVELTIEVFAGDGRRTGRASLLLPKGNRFSRTLPQLVPEVSRQVGGYIRLSSRGGPIVAFALFGDQGLESLAAVPPQPITP